MYIVYSKYTKSGPAGASRRVCSAREATNWPGSWQMELDIICGDTSMDGVWPTDKAH